MVLRFNDIEEIQIRPVSAQLLVENNLAERYVADTGGDYLKSVVNVFNLSAFLALGDCRQCELQKLGVDDFFEDEFRLRHALADQRLLLLISLYLLGDNVQEREALSHRLVVVCSQQALNDGENV